uniref:Coiled-coil domain-containing protein 91-like n=1 Tax=Castor canadensis TaxID=51338 RepID=A0A8B7U0Z7_CASCN|nr:coiled-coil domain-containing protein 91-like [Castor canadensis]
MKPSALLWMNIREKCNLHCELPSRIYGRTSLMLSLMPMWNKVSGVHLAPASPEIVLDHEHSSPSVGCLSSDVIISSPENTHADNSIVSQTVPKAQIQQSTHTHLDIPLFPLGLTNETSNGTIVLVDDSDDLGANVSNIELQQKISSLEIKLKVSEEEKQRIKKDVESLMEKHSILEKGFLKEKEQEAISFQDRYKELQVPLKEWMMMILVVLRLQRPSMVGMVKLKPHLLLFLGLPFLQVLAYSN